MEYFLTIRAFRTRKVRLLQGKRDKMRFFFLIQLRSRYFMAIAKIRCGICPLCSTCEEMTKPWSSGREWAPRHCLPECGASRKIKHTNGSCTQAVDRGRFRIPPKPRLLWQQYPKYYTLYFKYYIYVLYIVYLWNKVFWSKHLFDCTDLTTFFASDIITKVYTKWRIFFNNPPQILFLSELYF